MVSNGNTNREKVKSLRNIDQKDWLIRINHVSNLLSSPKAPRDIILGSGKIEFEIPNLEKPGVMKKVVITEKWIENYLLLGESLGYFEKSDDLYSWKDGQHVEINCETLRLRVLKFKQCQEVLKEIKKYNKPVPRGTIINTVSQTAYDPYATSGNYRGYDQESLITAVVLLESAGFIRQFKDYAEIPVRDKLQRRKIVFLEIIEG
ncbi:MAG: hypothetical protein ACFFD4_19795 [Candidatus Odinarchaeota archaeon]